MVKHKKARTDGSGRSHLVLSVDRAGLPGPVLRYQFLTGAGEE